jgi:hypothetical protein
MSHVMQPGMMSFIRVKSMPQCRFCNRGWLTHVGNMLGAVLPGFIQQTSCSIAGCLPCTTFLLRVLCAVLRQLPSLLDLCVDSNPFTAASRNNHPAATAAAAAAAAAAARSSSKGTWYREAVLLAACTPALLRLDGQPVSENMAQCTAGHLPTL